MKIRLFTPRATQFVSRAPQLLLPRLVPCSLALVAAAAQGQEIFRPLDAPPPVESVVVTATRLPVPVEQSPSAVTVIGEDDISARQLDRVADVLRAVPGLSVVQSGAPGQLTSVFTRGLKSEHTQVLLDGIPLNQGLAGLFNFADLTTSGIARIEVERGPQSTLYGPRALAGAIQLFSRRGDVDGGGAIPTVTLSAEGGSYFTFREQAAAVGAVNGFDYSLAASRLDTDNERPNNEYRLTDTLVNIGYTLRGPQSAAPQAPSGKDGKDGKDFAKNSAAPAPEDAPPSLARFGFLFTYSLADTGNPNTIFTPRRFDNFLTERTLYAPNVEFNPTRWWHHKLVVEYDEERQVNNPNEDGFTGPTRGQFNRYQLDYQNDIEFSRWVTLTTGAFYQQAFALQRRPFVGFGPGYIKDFTENEAGFAQLSIKPIKNLLLVAGGRYDHFNQFGDVWTYRVAASYLIEQTQTTLRSSVATGFSPPTPQDRIFGNNLSLDPEETFGYDFGFEQGLFKDRLRFGANYFYNDLSNVIGFDQNFNTFNLGSARTQGTEVFARWEPLDGLLLRASYTYLDAKKTSERDINAPDGSRLPRRPRNEAFVSAAYRPPFLKQLTATVEAKFVNAREEGNFGAANFDIEDYAVVRLLADYTFNDRVRVFGRVENLTDEDYSEVFGYPALGRAFVGGLAVRF
jgi:vitamin B12 transporter